MLEWLDEPDSMMKESLNRPKLIPIEKFDDYHKQVLQIVKNFWSNPRIKIDFWCNILR